MSVVWIIVVLLCLAFIVAAFVGQLAWRQAIIYLAVIGFIALALTLLLPRL